MAVADRIQSVESVYFLFRRVPFNRVCLRLCGDLKLPFHLPVVASGSARTCMRTCRSVPVRRLCNINVSSWLSGTEVRSAGVMLEFTSIRLNLSTCQSNGIKLTGEA